MLLLHQTHGTTSIPSMVSDTCALFRAGFTLTISDFSAVDWSAFLDTIPAMFALTFFGVLHVPINVPALGISTGEDNLNVDRELIAHGVTNALSGFAGSIQVAMLGPQLRAEVLTCIRTTLSIRTAFCSSTAVATLDWQESCLQLLLQGFLSLAQLSSGLSLSWLLEHSYSCWVSS